MLCFGSAVAAGQEIVWRDSLHFDFGEITQGRPVHHVFHFTNNSTDTIDIETVRTDCGCTDTEWTKTDIPPKSSGTVTVNFDAKNRGYFNRKVRVYFRQMKKPSVLRISGTVF